MPMLTGPNAVKGLKVLIPAVATLILKPWNWLYGNSTATTLTPSPTPGNPGPIPQISPTPPTPSITPIPTTSLTPTPTPTAAPQIYQQVGRHVAGWSYWGMGVAFSLYNLWKIAGYFADQSNKGNKIYDAGHSLKEKVQGGINKFANIPVIRHLLWIPKGVDGIVSGSLHLIDKVVDGIGDFVPGYSYLHNNWYIGNFEGLYDQLKSFTVTLMVNAPLVATEVKLWSKGENLAVAFLTPASQRIVYKLDKALQKKLAERYVWGNWITLETINYTPGGWWDSLKNYIVESNRGVKEYFTPAPAEGFHLTAEQMEGYGITFADYLGKGYREGIKLIKFTTNVGMSVYQFGKDTVNGAYNWYECVPNAKEQQGLGYCTKTTLNNMYDYLTPVWDTTVNACKTFHDGVMVPASKYMNLPLWQTYGIAATVFSAVWYGGVKYRMSAHANANANATVNILQTNHAPTEDELLAAFQGMLQLQNPQAALQFQNLSKDDKKKQLLFVANNLGNNGNILASVSSNTNANTSTNNPNSTTTNTNTNKA